MAQQIQSVQHIPVEVQRLAEAHSLGMPTASYSERPFLTLVALIIGLLGSLFLLGLFILSLFGFIPLPGLLLFFTAAMGGTTILLYEKQKQQVHVYTEGFVYLRWRKVEELRWEQIETLWYESKESDLAWDSLRLRKTDGSELNVRVSPVLRNWPEIYRTIEREFVRMRLPAMLEQYEAGNEIAFGELSVNKLGLTRKGETLPWSQVGSIKVGEPVKIKKQGEKWGYWSARSVPNPSLLQELVTHIRSSP